MATTANFYIVDNDAAWGRLRQIAAADWLPGSPGERLYLNAQIGEAATTHGATPDECGARLRGLIAHIDAAGEMNGLHGPFLSLMAAAELRGDQAALQAAQATWQKFGSGQAARPVIGSIPIYDLRTRDWALAKPSQLTDALPPLPQGGYNPGAISNFLNGIDQRINDAFGNPHSSNPAFDAGVSVAVSDLNEAAVALASAAVVGFAVPGGQAIGAILLVGAGAAAIGAAAARLFGTLADLFTGTKPVRVAVADPNPGTAGTAGTSVPYEPGAPVGPPPSTGPTQPSTPPSTTNTEPAQPADDQNANPASPEETQPTPTNDPAPEQGGDESTTASTPTEAAGGGRPANPSSDANEPNDIPETRETGPASNQETATSSPEPTSSPTPGAGPSPGAVGIPDDREPLRVADAQGDE